MSDLDLQICSAVIKFDFWTEMKILERLRKRQIELERLQSGFTEDRSPQYTAETQRQVYCILYAVCTHD